MQFKLLAILLFIAPFVKSTEENSYLSNVYNGVDKFNDVTHFVTEFLEDFNDRHLGNSEWGKMLGYKDIKPKIGDLGSSRGLKKMSMAMMPLVFHIGATSTWMILTSIMAVKSVAIGLILLVFKIAVSSAKVASFFTLLKSKHGDHHEHTWSPHGRDSVRSLSQYEIPVHADWNSYTPEWSHGLPPAAYKTVPEFKENVITDFDDEVYEETKSAQQKNG